MEAITVGQAAARTGWSPRMLRYVERVGLVVPERTPRGYRLYGLRELNQLRSLAQLRRRFGVALDELAFAARLRREPQLRAAVETWLAGSGAGDAAWVEWEQRKHERLLAA
jgi:MerR family transcriptional regulator, copper efflux regulator